MKTSAILAASIATLMAGSVMADATVYGRARMALVVADGADNVGLVNDSSRIGFKGSEDLGNGMSAIYHYEFGYQAANAADGGLSNRIGVVGLKGDFGTFAMGNMWVPTYNLVVGSQDLFNHKGSDDGYQTGSRAGDALAYVNKFGSVDFQAAVVSNDSGTEEDLMDAYNVAVKFPAGPVSIGLGVHSNTDDTGMVAAVNFKGDGFTAGVGISNAEDIGGDNLVTLTGTADVGSGQVLARFSTVDIADNTLIALGYHHNLSKRTQAYVEMNTNDKDDTKDETVIGLKHNF